MSGVLLIIVIMSKRVPLTLIRLENCTQFQLNDVKQFCLKYNLDKGFVFMFISYENPDFDDTTLKTLSISLDN